MSGPDRRDTEHIPGQDPMDEQFETPEVNLSYRKAYHVRADVKVTFTPGCTSPANYHVQAAVKSEFKAREGEWNNLTGSAGTLHTDLDVADELFEDDE